MNHGCDAPYIITRVIHARSGKYLESGGSRSPWTLQRSVATVDVCGDAVLKVLDFFQNLDEKQGAKYAGYGDSSQIP